MSRSPTRLLVALALAVQAGPGLARETVGQSPWGPADEIGRLNLMTPASRAAILSRVAGDRVYDLSVDYFIGMPSWQAAGDPHYRIWMTHTPSGTVIDDPLGLGRNVNEHVSYTGAAISMYTHTGTHIDALSHFGLDGRVWNGHRADEHLGDRGWRVTDAAKIPPIIARGVLIYVAAAKKVDMLPDGYRVTRADLVHALRSAPSRCPCGPGAAEMSQPTHPIGVRGIDHVVLRVRDLERMITFYGQVLNCPLERGPGAVRLAQLRAGASLIDLVDVEGPLGRRGGDAPDGRRRNMDHVCLQVSPWDAAAITAHLRAHGVETSEVATRYGAQGHGPSLYLRDPEGNTVELKGPPTRQEDLR